MLYEISWHELELSDQKVLLFMMTNANDTINLTYLLGDLSFESFVSVSLIFDDKPAYKIQSIIFNYRFFRRFIHSL